jgi:hypothetical protein
VKRNVMCTAVAIVPELKPVARIRLVETKNGVTVNCEVRRSAIALYCL